MLTASEQYLINRTQALDLPSALLEAETCLSCYRHASRLTKSFWKALGHACLNRACDLACVPLAQHYVETSSGDLDLVWVTYKPEVVPWSENCDPAAMVYLGRVDNLTEDQARSRAIGW